MDTVEPNEAGFSSDRLRRINAVMQSYVDQDKLAGLITMVARGGKLVHLECYGMMDIEAGKSMQFDTIFRIYSMTKPITSVAFMMLYEEGRVHLYDPVSKFIPEFAAIKVFAGDTEVDLEREITVHDLLTHTAGFTYDFFDSSPVDLMYRETNMFDPIEVPPVSLSEFLMRIVKLPLVHQPGTTWRYSVATDVLGHLIEIISGISLDSFLRERLFKPLGMEDTGFHVPKAKLDRFAAMYEPVENNGMELLDAPAKSPFLTPPRCLLGGSGLVSTATDYMRFAQMLLNGGMYNEIRILSPKTIELMTINHLPNEMIPIQVEPHTLHGCGFGLGFRVLVDVAQCGRLGTEGEFGWGGAASTSFFIDPQEDLVGLLLTQLMPSRYYPIRSEFKVLVYQALVD
jgi:CubicO group peptidase (beta-lactamase class C family)